MLALELRHRPLVVGWCHICLYLYQVLCAAWSILVANVARSTSPIPQVLIIK